MLDNEIDEKHGKKGRRIRKKGVYLLPNLITSASLFGGFYAIIAAFDGEFQKAAVAILVSAVLDGLDGRVARLTGSSSKFGVEYDSLSDLVAFGIAPGVLIFTWALKPFGKYGWLAAFLYVVCGALRLARFNVQITTVERGKFSGLPIPLAAALLASTVLMYHYLGLGAEYITVLVMVYALAFLMISNVKYYSFKEFNLTKRMPFRFLVGLVFLLVVIAAEPVIMLFLLTGGYVLSGPVTLLLSKRKKLAEKLGHRKEEKHKEAHR